MELGGFDLGVLAADLAEARRSGALALRFDGVRSLGVLDAYALQKAAARLVDDRIGGWKVGRLALPTMGPGRTSRFIGPIFRGTVRRHRGHVARIGASSDRASAVEAEFVVKLRRPLPDALEVVDDDFWRSSIAAIHVGVELAGNDLTPTTSAVPNIQVAAFGNNRGLIVGEPIPPGLWSRPLAVRTIVEGATVGALDVVTPWSAAIVAMADARAEAASLGMAFEEGQWVATGALTGIHAIVPAQNAIVVFEGYEPIQMISFDPGNRLAG